MSIIHERGASAKSQTELDEYRRLVKSRAPALASLLDNLDAGNSPNFLDILAGLSEMVAFVTECDSIPEDQYEKNICMSGKNCRFCC